MTFEILQNDANQALKDGNKERRSIISGFIAQIKRVAIDKGCRDNIPEELVNTELLKIKKNLQRQYQRIKYNVRVGKDILPGSAIGVPNSAD